MAEKYFSKYTGNEIDSILETSDKKPFVLYYDSNAQVYRFFRTDEKMQAWIDAQNSEEGIPPEIDEYQFTIPFTAPAPYSIVIDGLEDQQYILKGTKNNYLTYTFRTIDGNGIDYGESVTVYYTFKSSEGSKTVTKTYNTGTTVKLKIDDYLAVGTNNITLFVRGLSTKATKIEIRNYYLVELDLRSSFDISKPIDKEIISIPYTLIGQGDRSVYLYIDGEQAALNLYNADTEEIIDGVFNIQTSKYNPGVHSLQLVASSRGQFYSKSLYYEFAITGSLVPPTILIKYEFPPSNDNNIIITNPNLEGEQYVLNVLDWVYYYEDPDLSSHIGDSAIITWILQKDSYSNVLSTEETTSALSNDVVERLNFIPSVFGNYNLVARFGDTTLKEYPITINKNKYGLEEADPSSLYLKLSGVGRSNSEPKDILTSWESNTTGAKIYRTTFYNQPWNSNSGWSDNALVLNNGATAEIDMAPFDDRNVIDVANQGCVIELDFETFNVHDNNSTVIKIGETSINNETQLVVKPSIATLTSQNGVSIVAKYKSDERIKLTFVIYPLTYVTDPSLSGFMFIYCNGVLSGAKKYKNGDSFSNSGYIKLGSAVVNNIEYNGSDITQADDYSELECGSGIKIYYLRVYPKVINMYQALNNFIIDQNDYNIITELAEKNDLFASSSQDGSKSSTLASKSIDVDKLRSLITTVEITGDLVSNQLIGTNSKQAMYGGLRIYCNENPSLNMHCNTAYFSNAGQSTLDKPIPSLHVKLDKDKTNVCYDDNDNIYPGNRWTFREGNVPEKKFRLQANYMDSSCAHNAAFFRLFNEVSSKIDLLQIPAIKYANNEYSAEMESKHGSDPNNNGWKFPYNLHMVPDSIPCVVIWRENEQSPFKYLGQYVLMEEKKANFSNGMRSIYDTIDNERNPDPFQFRKKNSGSRIWDNNGCHQFELLTSTDDLTLFLNTDGWDDENPNEQYFSGRYPEREKCYEIIYPDQDDLLDDDPSGGKIRDEWDLFYGNFLSRVCNTKDNQPAFNELYESIFDRWQWAAYYCLALRNCCSDSFARNIEITTYDGGQTWLPKWWDVDMQCGLHQTGACNIDPPADRDTRVANDTTYALSGRTVNEVTYELKQSSWLWDGLEGCDQFKKDVATMDKLLYSNGWTYYNMNRIMDEEYVNKWSQTLYNYSSVSKYLDYSTTNTDNLVSLQGDRTPHRHWFLRTSYDYFDAIHVCGEFLSKTINVRTEIPINTQFKIVAGIDSYFGWGTSISNDETGIKLEKGQEWTFSISRALQLNNPLHIFGASKIQELDLSDIARYMASNLDFTSTYDSVTGTYLRKLNIGVKDNVLADNYFNEYDTFNAIGGLKVLEKVEEFNIQGLYFLDGLDLEFLKSLKKFKAKGTQLRYFSPANGCSLSVVELPSSIRSITMNECSLTKTDPRKYNNCSISWFETIETGEPQDIELYYIYSVIRDELTNEIIEEGWVRCEPPENTDNINTIYKYSDLEKLQGEENEICKLIIRRKQKIIVPLDSIPSTVTSLYFKSMGDDIGTQELIEDWLTAINLANPEDKAGYELKDYSITYTNVSWGGKKEDSYEYISENKDKAVSIDLLRILARIPVKQRKISGYIRARGTGDDYSFTPEEINFLLDNFGQNIFNINNSLCIDGVSGNIIISAVGLTNNDNVTVDSSGKICITQGSTARVVANGFPLSTGTYMWGCLNSGSNSPIYTNDSVPQVYINGISDFILTKNGLIQTEECSQQITEFVIYCAKLGTDGNLLDVKPVDVKIIPKEYPTSSSIIDSNGNVISSLEISEPGVYHFNVIYNLTSFTGTMNNEIWNYNALVSDSSGSYNFSTAGLNPGYINLFIYKLPDNQIVIPLRHISYWKNESIVISNTLTISIVNNDTILSRGENQALYDIFDTDVGITHIESLKYSAIDLKSYIGNIIVLNNTNASQLIDFLGNADKNVLSYLSNVEVLDVRYCENLTGDIDISLPNLNYKQVILHQNASSGVILPDESTSIQKLILGKPKKLKIHNPSTDFTNNDNNFSITSSENLTSLELVNINNHTFETAANIILDQNDTLSIDSEVSPNFNYVKLYQDQTVNESITPDEINRLADLCIDNLSSTSIMFGKLHSSTGYIYQSSKDAICNKFNTNNEQNIIITTNNYYLEFPDKYFRKLIAKIGDNYGLKTNQISSVNNNAFTNLKQNTNLCSLVESTKGTENLTSLTFPSLSDPNDSPFLGYDNLTTVYFPSNLQELGKYTFNGNTNLVNINFNGCTSLTTIEENSFYECTGPTKVDLSDCTDLDFVDLKSLVNLDQLTIDPGNNSCNITRLIL